MLQEARGAPRHMALRVPLFKALLREAGTSVGETQEYFLDDEYRSSPLEYRPSQTILQFTVAPVTR